MYHFLKCYKLNISIFKLKVHITTSTFLFLFFSIKRTYYYESLPEKNHMFIDMGTMWFFEIWKFKFTAILAHHELVYFRKPPGNKGDVT